MKFDEMFIESAKLPKPLEKEELYSYFRKYKQGDLKARNIIITNNISLVLKKVNIEFKNTTFEKKDLVSIGIIGLIKSVDTFDLEKNFEFSTYAGKCIDNEILMFLKQNKEIKNERSFELPIYESDKNGEEICLKDSLVDDNSLDFVSNIEIRNIINNLPNREKQIILLYFGFIDNHTYSQRELAEKINLSQSSVSKLLPKIIEKIKIELETTETFEDEDIKQIILRI